MPELYRRGKNHSLSFSFSLSLSLVSCPNYTAEVSVGVWRVAYTVIVKHGINCCVLRIAHHVWRTERCVFPQVYYVSLARSERCVFPRCNL